MENKKFYNKSFSGRSLVAGLLLIGGLVCGIYYLVFFTTSVEVPQQEIMGQVFGGGEVNNIGLMQDRQKDPFALFVLEACMVCWPPGGICSSVDSRGSGGVAS
jgi:hypothetical protein